MKILTVMPRCYTQANINNNQNGSVRKYNPTFGVCNIHVGRMKTANKNVEKAIDQTFAEYSMLKGKITDYAQKLSFMKNAQKQAAYLITQYANYQYSLAEVIPSYALESSSELMKTIEQTKVFDTPQEILLTIANIPKLEMMSGINEYTGQAYSVEQLRKSKASSQLHSVAIMLDLLDKKIATSKMSPSEKTLVVKMRNDVFDSISSIYGKDAYARIQKMKMMGENASFEDKKAALNLLQELDNIAKKIDFSNDFYKNLDVLLKHKETFGTSIEADLEATKTQVPKITLYYHTHPEDSLHEHTHGHTHEHTHEHAHEHMHTHVVQAKKQLETK